MLYIFLLILAVSFILALRSMKDFGVPKEIKRLLDRKKAKGTIIFSKKKMIHYSSGSSSLSSD
ncbi:MAG: hypothetical protein UR68_C0012G0041 [Candidatus Roizmanbacteria bacterium GW2011_GWA2_35_19]|uniref:Uncharacterized protein n=2 Tax=Candidatus Roizmaniibacteriota TaxID=1752723 RepID=A0A0G0BU72_9BACT|nr:MAG: hypothetical protein UR68_C0012G0041 [Candidatus Roizmanbacteria bacterium GW2011_GWA2_35_19]